MAGAGRGVGLSIKGGLLYASDRGTVKDGRVECYPPRAKSQKTDTQPGSILLVLTVNTGIQQCHCVTLFIPLRTRGGLFTMFE